MAQKNLVEQISQLTVSQASSSAKDDDQKSDLYPYVLVDNDAALEQAVEVLSKYKEIAFDGEGVDLSRIGPLTVVSLSGCDATDKDDEGGVVYLVDILKLGKAKVFPSNSTKVSLKTILESQIILKVMFDSRADSDALYHQYGVRLDNVLDLQLFDQGCRIANGEKPPCRSAGGWIPFVKGMKDVMKNYLPDQLQKDLYEYGAAPHSKDFNVWGKRPLDKTALKYAANDAYIIKFMLLSMRGRNIPDDLMKAVTVHSNNRVGMFRDSANLIVFNPQNKKLIMEERPIVPLNYQLQSKPKAMASITQVTQATTTKAAASTVTTTKAKSSIQSTSMNIEPSSSSSVKTEQLPSISITKSSEASNDHLDDHHDDPYDDDYDDYDYDHHDDDDFGGHDISACDSECGYCGKCNHY